jgi:hypothetical protein
MAAPLVAIHKGMILDYEKADSSDLGFEGGIEIDCDRQRSCGVGLWLTLMLPDSIPLLLHRFVE